MSYYLLFSNVRVQQAQQEQMTVISFMADLCPEFNTMKSKVLLVPRFHPYKKLSPGSSALKLVYQLLYSAYECSCKPQ